MSKTKKSGRGQMTRVGPREGFGLKVCCGISQPCDTDEALLEKKAVVVIR